MTQKTALKLIPLAIVASILLSTLVGCAKPQNEEAEAATEQTELQTDELVQFSDIEEKEYFTLKYENSEFGRIEGELEQTVKKGEHGSTVKAVADDGYVFVGWSDGKLSESRKDALVKSDITVYPVFKKAGTKFSVTYVIKNSGKVILEETKTEVVGKTVRMEAESAEFGWEFTWSDGKNANTRLDSALIDGQTIVGSYSPKFLEAPVICINTDDGEDITSKTEYKSGTVTLMNAGEAYCFEDVSAEVRGRGNSSWGHPKKSYRIKFEEKRSMMGTSYEARSWTLIANFSDKSLSRNAIAYEFASRLPNIKFSSIHQFVDLYLNGEYLGVYLLCDQIQVGEGRVDIDESLDGDLDTGYLIEIDNRAVDEGELGKHYFRANDNKTYTLKSPDPDAEGYSSEYLRYIEDYVNRCIAAMESGDWALICEYIDVDSFVDGYIAQEVFANLDCHSFSFFLYKDKGGKMTAGPVWDYDIGAGNNDYGLGTKEACLPNQDIINSNKLWVAGEHKWFGKLLKCDEFLELVREKLVEYKPYFMETVALLQTDGKNAKAYYSLYGKAMERNFIKWDIMGSYVWPNPQVIVDIKTLKGQLNYLRTWLIERYYVVCDWYDVHI